MTKISGIDKNILISHVKQMREADPDLFKKTLENAVAKKEVSETQKIDTAPLEEVRSPIPTNVETPSIHITRKASELLDKLDAYAKILGGTDKTLKEIEPFILEIKENATTLIKQADESSEKDPELKRIAKACAVAANVEFLKFQRGDYI